jgi:hypothetical protein
MACAANSVGRPKRPDLPASGQKFAFGHGGSHRCVVPVDPILVDHVVASTGLTPGEAARLVQDVVAFHAEPLEGYVRRRHHELKTHGAKNPEIFARIAAELGERVVAAPELTERQLRRIVYG